ncbi:unnamed protein product [Aphanomyces euteiches]|uniref:Anaphase-promoting complex subunit 4 WD40 domain-containing protein n=1 Tax=Aphanomyces euteiches TaxID=100861 RepID=A0A6G0XIB0_9STRA|nr:hypothetical protein Ae201684_004593 [Aphanomyces euteiches]KAH9094009.1 hypothetical protein Ae201684P_016627 [Aphanomyces euteiches]
MRVIVGDETGLVKNISLEASSAQLLSGSSQSRATSARYLAWTDNDVVVARMNGHVDCVDIHGGASPWSFTREGSPVGLGVISEYGSIVRCNTAGRVEVVHPLHLKPNPPSFDVGHDIQTLRVDPFGSHVIAIGGKERDVNLWNLETQQAIFKAKNIPHDNLDMRVPVWVKAMAFLPSANDGHHLAVGTAYHQIRIYDTKTKRRPVSEASFGEHPITSLVVHENRVIFGDTAGNVNALDLRTFKHLGRYHGPVGSIRDIALHPSLPYMAAVGLDRMVHVFHVDTRKAVHTYYAKQRLNAVLFTDEGVKPVPVAKPEPVEPTDDDAMGEDDEEDGGDEDEDDDVQDYEGLEIDSDEDDDDDDDDEDMD